MSVQKLVASDGTSESVRAVWSLSYGVSAVFVTACFVSFVAACVAVASEKTMDFVSLDIRVDGTSEGDIVYLSGVSDDVMRLVLDDGGVSVHQPLKIERRATLYFPDIEGQQRHTVYVEPSSIQVSIEAGQSQDPVEVKVAGSESHALYVEFQEILAKGRPDVGGERHRSISDRTRRAEQVLALANGRKESIVARDIIAEFLKSPTTVNVPIATVTAMQSFLHENFPDYESTDFIGTSVISYENRQPGEKLSGLDYVGESPSGNLIRLTENLGDRYTLVDLWASWCGACREEFPHLKDILSRYSEYGFTVFAISHDSNKKRWVDAIEKDGIGVFTHASQLNGSENEISKSYSISGVPANFLIDSDGNIVGNDLFGPVLDAKLAELYGDQREHSELPE